MKTATKTAINTDQPAVAALPAAGVSGEALRYHSLDNLRASAMLLGVVFHAALAYSPLLSQTWPSADGSAAASIDFFVWLSHTFRMPLFFLIAGFFANLMITKRSLKAFMLNRCLRVALPFIIFWPLISLVLVAVLYIGLTWLAVNTPALNAIEKLLQNPEPGQQSLTLLSTGHLWFLYYLLIFYLLAALAKKFLSLPPKWLQCLVSPAMLLGIWPLIAALALLGQPMPHPPPASLLPAPWAVIFYGQFFFVGWLYYGKQPMLNGLYRQQAVLLLFCALLSGVFFLHLPEPITVEGVAAFLNQSPIMERSHWVLVLATAFLAWYVSLLCVMQARKYFAVANPVMRYLADASYWTYLVHLPLVYIMQMLFYFTQWPILIELCLSVGLTLVICFASYQLAVRNTFVGRFLNGRRNSR